MTALVYLCIHCLLGRYMSAFHVFFTVIYIVLLDAGQFTCWNLLFVVDVYNYIREHLCPI